MCNEAARRVSLGLMREDWNDLRIPLRFPEGLPNFPPTDGFRITDTTLIFRAARDLIPEDAFAAEGVMRRWSWPGPGGKPVYNYRSENREFRNSTTQGRCLIAADAFYEFTNPDSPPVREGLGEGSVAPGGIAHSLPQPLPKGRGAKKKKDKWSFTKVGEQWFGIAGLWKADPTVGEAFTMLTTEPGPDVAPYHSRQIVLVERAAWAGWLSGELPAAEVCRALPAGSLAVAAVGR